MAGGHQEHPRRFAKNLPRAPLGAVGRLAGASSSHDARLSDALRQRKTWMAGTSQDKPGHDVERRC
jgi:hypothetical protein